MKSDSKNYLGIDYGHVRLGLAVAGSDTLLARPLTTLEKSGDQITSLKQIIEREAIDTLVVGLPRSLDGEDTLQTETVRHFAAQLADLGLPVKLQDEAGTSSLALERIGTPTSIGQIDQEAAAIILQDYLNTLDNTSD